MDGKKADAKSSGYIVEAYGKLVVRGFRKDHDTVGAFKFTKKEKSYAAGKGDPTNVGVIAVAVFEEKRKIAAPQIVEKHVHHNHWYDGDYWYPRPWYPKYPWKYWYDNSPMWCSSLGGTSMNSLSLCGSTTTQNVGAGITLTSACAQGDTLRGSVANNTMRCADVSAGGSMEESDLKMKAQYAQSIANLVEDAQPFQAGTDWGSKLNDKVVNATFEKEHTNPFATFEIFYDFKEGLEQVHGIKLVAEKKVAFPKGFSNGFAESPAGWNG